MLELIVPSQGGLRRGTSAVTISGRFSRLLIYKEAYAEMKCGHGHDFEHVQFLSNPEEPEKFWIRPANRDAPGSARIVVNAANGTRTISASHLMKFLKLGRDQSVCCPLRWDHNNQAAVVMVKPVDR